MRRLVSVSLLTCSLALTAGAQEKISGTLNCPKPATREMGEAGDMPGHILGFTKNTCTWSTPLDTSNLQAWWATSLAVGSGSGDDGP